MENKKKGIIFFVILFFVFLLVVILHFSGKITLFNFFSPEVPNNPLVADPYEFVLATDENFAACTTYLQQNKYLQAVIACENALAAAEDPIDRLYVKYPLALAYSGFGSTAENDDKFEKSIALFKEIIAYPDGPPTLKAQSVRSLDELLFSPDGWLTRTLLVKDEPYKTFANGTARNFSIKLLEYGEGFKRLAGIEMRLASLYAMELLEIQKGAPNPVDGSTAVKIANAKLAINERMVNGENDLKEVRSIDEFSYLIAPALLHKAIAADYYQRATGEVPFGNPETLYGEALTTARNYSSPNTVSLASYWYAVYLAEQQNPDRKMDAQKMLLHFTKDGNIQNSYMGSIFQNLKLRTPQEKQRVILLASIDPEFKSTLLRLGWSEKDFVQ